MQTSLYMGILLLIVDIGTYFLDVRAGFLLTCFLLFYFGMIILLMFYNRPIILNELISFATQYGQVQKTLLRDMAIPYALLDETGRVIWCNDAFRAAIHSEKGFHKSITYVSVSYTHLKNWQMREKPTRVEMRTPEMYVVADKKTGALRFLDKYSEILLEESGQDRCLIENAPNGGRSRLFFDWKKGDGLYAAGALGKGGIHLEKTARCISHAVSYTHLQADRPFRFMSKRFGIIHRTHSSKACLLYTSRCV